MSKPTPLSGYPELLPAARTVEREAIASLSRTFELHGFANIETRVVDPARLGRAQVQCAPLLLPRAIRDHELPLRAIRMSELTPLERVNAYYRDLNTGDPE